MPWPIFRTSLSLDIILPAIASLPSFLVCFPWLEGKLSLSGHCGCGHFFASLDPSLSLSLSLSLSQPLDMLTSLKQFRAAGAQLRALTATTTPLLTSSTARCMPRTAPCTHTRRHAGTGSNNNSEPAHDFFSEAPEFANEDGNINRVKYPANHYTYYVEPSEYEPSLQEESSTNSKM